MLTFFLTWLVAAASLAITAWIVPGLTLTSWSVAAIGAVVLGLVNAIVKPILTILTLPITILSLGLFLFVVNAIALSLAGYLTPGFIISGFWPAFFGAIILSVVSGILGTFVGQDA